MYTLNKTIFLPTSVEHCVSCNFISEHEEHLIVSGANRLRFFQVCPLSASKTRLEQLFDTTLFGNIESLAPIRIVQRSSKLDCLLLAFSDAKLSIIEWDVWHHDIHTVSLHQFEDDELKDSVRNSLFRPEIRVDPQNRCAIMLFYGRHLAVLPFLSEDICVEKFVPDCESVSLSLHSYVVNLKDIDDSLCNILDFQFLHGYSDPTVVILYAPINTWIGIINSRKDNVKLIAISINLNDQSHPAIWSIPSLPCDTFGLLSIPKPIGGVLVFGANCVIHLNQGVPAYGISLNSFTESNTDFPLDIFEDVVISLDCSRFSIISDLGDTIALSTKDGDIYVVFLITDDMRKMKKIHFQKAASSVLCTSICVVQSNHLFLGSRLGNSLLLKFFPVSSPTIHSYEKSEHSNIDNHVDHIQDTNNNQLKVIKDDIDLEMYGLSIFPENELYFRVGSYTFEVCDSLTNISPIASMTIGQPLNISEEFSESVDSDIELVGCVGHSKNGSLAVLQKSIRPQLVTTSELIGSQDMWTLKTNGDEFHRFLLISQTDSTMVLQTGQEILELDQDQTEFCTNEKTFFAGNVLSNQLFIQVCSDSILLLENLKCLQSISMKEFDSQVLACSICDPLGVLLLESNKLLLLEVHRDKSIVLSVIPIRSSIPIVSLSLYNDSAHIFTIQSSTVNYSDADIHRGAQEDQKHEAGQSNEDSEKFPSFWLALVKNNGCLEILSVPKFNTVFMVRNFSFAPVLLIDCGHIDSDSGVSETISNTKSIVQEIMFTSLDINGKSPYILAIINNDLVIYKAFKISYSSHDGNLLFRFRRELVSILMNDRNNINIDECETVNFENVYSFQRKITPPRFREFSNIGSYPGVFICGPYPQWIFKSHKGTYFIHPMSIDGPVESFASFHNENCKFGCIYYNREGILRIALLPTFLNLESPWPLRKVPLRCTSHFVAYHIESKTYALALSNKMKGNILIKSTGDDTEEFETVSKGLRFIYPYQEKYFIELFSPTNWEAVPNTRFELYPFEHVTALKSLHLRSQERASGLKIFICVGTTVLYGEDFTAKGRILIFDVIDVVPEPGKPLTRNRLKLLYDKEQVGPISAIDQVDGLLFTCIGKKIFMWNFKDTKELIGVAFIDAELYIHSAISLKNYILVADISKSIQLLQYREDQKSLSLISKDPYQLRVFSIEYIIDGNQLGFLVSDSSKNLHLFQYQPDDPGSIGGLRLIRQGDIHIGSHINSMFRIRCKPSVNSGSSSHHITGMALNEKRHVTFYSTLDGSIGLIVPLSEKTFRRMQTLQNRLVQCIQHPAGLNPKSFRLAHISNRLQSTPQKNIIDGDLLWKYTYLGIKEKNELAKQIGTSSLQIMEDIRNIEKITDLF